MMKKIIYILLSAALVCGCDTFYGTIGGGSREIVEIVAINRSSVPVSLNVYGADWIDPQETIFLKPHEGLWKIEASRENYHGQDILPVAYSLIRADFNDGERVIWFDMFSVLPHNPCAIGAKELWDQNGQHRLIEFSDKICESVFAAQDQLHAFDISMAVSPSDVVDDLVVPGSTEAYFTSLYPAGKVKDQLKLGAVVYTEAETIEDVKFVEGLSYEAEEVSSTKESVNRYHHREVYQYYDMDQLRKLGLTNFGCDFAALTGRSDGRFDSFSGVALLQVEVGMTEEIPDEEYPEDFLEKVAGTSRPAGVIDRIDYGNFMLLLAEGDCSHVNIHSYVQGELLREDPSDYYYYEMYFTPELKFHLITLDENGSFVSQSGGEELAAVFYKGYGTPVLHPLSYHVNTLSEESVGIHVKGIK